MTTSSKESGITHNLIMKVHGDTYSNATPVLFESDGDRKWKMTESGNYTFVFDTKNLTLKVTKNSSQMAL